jgi:DNA-binding NtrC family response regulator
MKKRTLDHREGDPAPILEFEAVRLDDGAREAPIHSIHLLDGDSDSLLFLFEYLSTAGYNVSASSSAADAMMMIAKLHPQVLIADKDLRDMTRMELVQRVRALSPATRVILTTERLDGALCNQILRLGDVDLVVKPFRWEILMRAVERAVQGSSGWMADGADVHLRGRGQE